MRTHRGTRPLGRTGRPSALLAGLLTAALGATLVAATPLAALADDTSGATGFVDNPYADPEGRGPSGTTYSSPEVPAAAPHTSLAAGDELGAGYSVVDIGDGRRSNASGIAEDGTVSGTFFVGNENLPVVWKNGTIAQLGAPASGTGRRLVRAMSVGDDGTVAGWQFDDQERKRYAVAWHRKADGTYLGMQRVAEVSFGEEDWQYGGEGKAVSEDGSVLVTEPVEQVPWGSSLVAHPFGGFTELPPMPWTTGWRGGGTAHDMNNTQVAVGTISRDTWGYGAASWQDGAFSILPEAPGSTTGSTSEAVAVNDDGDVVVQTNTADGRSVMLHEQDGGWTDLGSVGAAGPVSNLEPWDVNNKDVVVGAAHVNGDSTRHAFIWRDGQAIDLNNYLPAVSGWELTAAHSINDRGQIVGIGWHRGVESGFVLDPTRPLLFVPGAGASILKSFDDPANPRELWLGCGTDRTELSLFPEDNAPQDVRAVDTTRYMECYGISGRKVAALDAYGSFLDALTKKYGYREYQVDEKVERRTTEGCDMSQLDQGPNMFVFAYDWRKDNRLAARQLEDYIGCIRRFFPDEDIDVVTHSMGSLVTRRYIMNNPGSTHIHKVVTIGAPWLGAPKLVNVLNTGDFVDHVADGDKVKHVAAGFRAAHELMSGPYYHELAGSVFSEEGWDYDGDGNAQEDYDWANLRSALNARIPRTQPADYAEAFQTEGGSDGQSDWSADSSGIDYTHIYGIQAGENTIGKVVAVEDVFCTPVVDLVCVHRDYIDQRMTQGDGTVPVTSANRVSADEDLNAPQARLLPIVVTDEDDNGTVEHTGLTHNPKVQQAIIDTFREDEEPPVQNLAPKNLSGPKTPAAYRYVTVREARDIVVHDGEGHDDALVNGDLRVSLPGVQHLTQGPDAELVTMPAEVGHDWTVSFRGTGRPMSVQAVEGTQSAPSTVVRYRDLVVPDGNRAELLLTPTGLERLKVDTDGDGDLDSTVTPTADLTGDSAQDVTAPQVAVSSTTVAGARRYVVSATDGEDGTGVRSVRWSTDGVHFTAYATPVDAGSATTLQAFAEDWAGNRSPVVALDLATAVEGPVTTATVDPAPSAQGWSAGPVTVTLSAQRGDTAPVRLIRYRTTGAERLDETTADGPLATVAIGTAGRTTVTYRAEAADGTVEPWRQLVVRIDAAAPAVKVQAPAPGSVVSTLPQVSGSAADDAAGVRSVEVLLERTSDGTYWDGEQWTAQPVWLAARGTTSWRVSGMPGIDDFTPGGYAVRARATDGADRVTTTAARTFVMAYAAPWKATALLPGGVMAHTSATDISDDGVVGGVVGTIPDRPVLWTGEQPRRLDTPSDAPNGLVDGVGQDGTAVGHVFDLVSVRTWGVHWRQDGSVVKLPDPAGTAYTEARAVSAAGAVGNADNRAVWWPDDEHVVVLPTLHDGESGDAMDIDESGTIVGYVTSPAGVSQAVVWTDGGRRVSPLGSLGGPGSQAMAINEVGQVVGWARNAQGRTRAFIADVRDGEGMIEVYVPSFTVQAHDVADDGTVVGEYLLGDGETHKAFMVRDGVFTRLDNLLPAGSGWDLVRANGINAVGQVTGFGMLNGVGRGFVMSAQHAPTAADVDATTDVGTPVELTLAATDPDLDTTLAYSLVGQPQHGTLSSLTGRTVTYTPAAGFSGSDAFSYRATDGVLTSNTASVTVSVRPGAPVNQKPTAVVTAPATVPEGSTVTLDGTSSSDVDGKVTSYAWDLDEDGDYDDATGPTATLDVHQDGTRTVGLMVVDDHGATATSVASVQVVNVAPAVSLPTTSTVQAGSPWSVTGSFGDPGDDSWSATVDLGDGLGAKPLGLTGKSFDVAGTFAAAGAREVRVSVCDGAACGSATTTVTVTPPPNRMPVALVADPGTLAEGSSVVLDGSGSWDPDGGIASYAWDLDADGAYDDAVGSKPTLHVDQDGTRVVGLRVVDDRGGVGVTTASVKVTNVAPTVTLPATSTASVGTAWSVTGSFADPGTDTWAATADLGDGSGATPLALTGKAFTVAGTFAAAGTRQVRVSVCDGTVCGTATTTVTVTAAPPPPSSWPWAGFFEPVDNVPTVNTVKAGQAIPLKFSVGGYRGMSIFAAGYPASAAHSCASSGPTDAVEETVNPGSSELSYAAGSDRYQYVWKTEKSWAGQCRTLVVKLADGSVHTAEFRFK